MRKNIHLFIFFFIAFSFCSQAGPLAAEPAAPTDFQKTPIILDAAEILPADLLKGADFEVNRRVECDGYVNVYTVTSTNGTMTVESTEALRERINELNAMAHMEALEKTKLFTDALKEGVKAPLKTAKGLVTEPVETVKGAATGIGRWFSDMGRAIVSDDPDQDNVLKTAIGYSGAKRKFAYEYGIDPYTRYKPVQDRIGEIARAAVAGGMTPKVAFGALDSPVGTVLRVTGTADSMRKLVRDKSPAELEKLNRVKLEGMGVSEGMIRRFLTHPDFNPQEETLLVGELEAMGGISGRNVFIAAAVQADSLQVARYMRLRAQMMGDYHRKIRPATRIVPVEGMPFLQTQNGTLVGLFPLDHVALTRKLWRKAAAAKRSAEALPGVGKKELWVDGHVTAQAKEAMESLGWRVVEDAGEKLR